MTEPSRYRFLLKNALRGLLVLSLFGISLVLFNQYESQNEISWLEPIFHQPALVYTVFSLSEVFFGIITPELFMLWGLKQTGSSYITVIAILMFISYGAGWINFLLGRRLRQIPRIRLFIRKRLKKQVKYLNTYGDFLLIVASITPLPYSATCLLVGTSEFSRWHFALYTSFRLLRFMLYGYLVWNFNKI